MRTTADINDSSRYQRQHQISTVTNIKQSKGKCMLLPPAIASMTPSVFIQSLHPSPFVSSSEFKIFSAAVISVLRTLLPHEILVLSFLFNATRNNCSFTIHLLKRPPLVWTGAPSATSSAEAWDHWINAVSRPAFQILTNLLPIPPQTTHILPP